MSPLFLLHARQEQSRAHNHAHLGQLRRLYSDEAEVNPTGRIVHCRTFEQHPCQHAYGYGHQQHGHSLVVAIGKQVQAIHYGKAKQQVD